MAAQDVPDSGSESIEELGALPDPCAESDVLTLEEIGKLAAEGGKPAETLMNVVALIARRFQHRCLLGLSAGAGSCQSGAGGHARPSSAMHRHAAHGAARRPGRAGGRAGASGRGRAGEESSALQVLSARPAKRSYQSFLGVPLIDRGVLQGVLVVQTMEARTFSDDEVHMLVRQRRRWRRW